MPNLSARRTAITIARIALMSTYGSFPPFLADVADPPAFTPPPPPCFAFLAARAMAAPSFDQGFSFPLKSSTLPYPFSTIIARSSSHIRSKHLGPSFQWHVPTCTALAPHRIISKASAPVSTPPTPTTSIDGSSRSRIFLTLARAVYLTALPDRPAKPPLEEITGISAAISTAKAFPIVLIEATYFTIPLYLLITCAALSK
mmetsp:Transcript_33335/g.73085  ORF Transcript_33335/g.73085 Transcript_33335/m.73085 type:complete len:201 (-) Transcript_33335:154-756(-)